MGERWWKEEEQGGREREQGERRREKVGEKVSGKGGKLVKIDSGGGSGRGEERVGGSERRVVGRRGGKAMR